MKMMMMMMMVVPMIDDDDDNDDDGAGGRDEGGAEADGARRACHAYVTSSASSCTAMFFNMPSVLRSKHSGSSSFWYALLCTNLIVAFEPLAAAAASASVTYGVTFLLSAGGGQISRRKHFGVRHNP